MVVPHLGFFWRNPECAMGPAWPHIHKSASGLDNKHFGGRAAENTRSLHFASLRSG